MTWRRGVAFVLLALWERIIVAQEWMAASGRRYPLEPGSPEAWVTEAEERARLSRFRLQAERRHWGWGKE